MDPRGKLRKLMNPSYVTGLIISGILKLARFAILDLSKYFLDKLSGRLLGLPDPFQLPRRYRLTSFGFSILGTVFFWGFWAGLFSSSQQEPSPFLFIFFSVFFYLLAVVILMVYRKGVMNLMRGLVYRLKSVGEKFLKIAKIWFP
ncbi:hypothetical protein K9M78_01430 [Candidatus Bipolaricaulota bacterium]|nr:hypothetical protein [Candidatus Bipolaricaulota bacterium]